MIVAPLAGSPIHMEIFDELGVSASDSGASSDDSVAHPLYQPMSASESESDSGSGSGGDSEQDDGIHERFGGPVFVGQPVVQPVAQPVP